MTDQEKPAGWYAGIPEPGYERFWNGYEWAGIRPIDTFPIKPSPVLSAAVIAQPRERKSRWPWIAGSIIALLIALFTIGVTIAAASEAPPATLPSITLVPCQTEDSENCYWDAARMGNGDGTSFVTIDGTVYYPRAEK